jgi:excisionase family DNA binding protein
MFMASDILTLREAAEYLKVSKVTLARWVNKNQVPGIKRGTIYLFHRNVLERWVMGELESSPTGGTK